MRTIYLDLGMGAAGDMLTAALLELLPAEEQEKLLADMNSMGIPNVEIVRECVPKNSIIGSRMRVTIHGEEEGENIGCQHHHHVSMQDVEAIIDNLATRQEVKEDILAVYKIIAEAESRAHGAPVSEIHFHEVGMMDAIADVASVCLLMHTLAPARVIASPIHVGSGHVHSAHGILPVPAPATAYILEGVPIYGGKIKGELCTPTGAALVKYFADAFDDLPVMTVQAVGYGFGKKEFEQMNCVRAFLGEIWEHANPMFGGKVSSSADAFENETAPDISNGQVVELVCNIDDMTGEEVGFACERLLASGAREVFTVAAQMKKFRPGIVLHVIADAWREEEMARRIFALTTTIGVRSSATKRYVLERMEETVRTPLGEVRRKMCSGYGVERNKWEYDDLAAIGREHGMSVREVQEALDAAEAEG
ncbi:MAG: nickel pincer cofactor biosynthesis protein LarC [Lachnospiraceae bacterium]|nr:nickel pincer cofactor biosynthesis protein LarC [Lachnospiraceae bacterium]